MSRLGQWEIFKSRSPVREAFFFFGIFFALRCLFRFALSWACELIDMNPQMVVQVLDSNELFVQTVALLAALVGLFQYQKLSWKTDLLQNFFGAQKLTREDWLSTLSGSLLWGFLAASAGVAVSIFLGFSSIQAPIWSLSGVLYMLPALLLRSLLWVLWILAMELSRAALWPLLTSSREDQIPGRLMLITFEAFLLFFAINGEGAVYEQFFLGLVSIWGAAVLLLWFEYSRSQARSLRSTFRRLAFLSGMGVGLFHIYGMPLAGSRYSSLFYLYPGPTRQPTGAMADQGVLGQVVFVLLFVALANALLQKALSRSTRS
jgi:hypothetical protein